MGCYGPRHLFRSILAMRSIFIVIIAFLVPISLLFEDEYKKEFRCAYVLIVIAILWITEALPISATALAPIFLLPMFGVMPAKTVGSKYLSDTNILFLGGLIIAVAMEEVNLHRRIAVGFTMMLGSRMNTLMLGLMLPTWFLSMWISNTAATAMMVPIIVAVTEQMADVETSEQYSDKESQDNEMVEKSANGTPSIRPDDKDEKTKQRVQELRRIGKGFSLCVAYGANIGGVATLTGTPPNLVLQGQADIQFMKYSDNTMDAGITYASWMGFGFPLSLLLLLLSWVWLQIFFLGTGMCKNTDEIRKNAIKIAIRREWKKLGKFTMAEFIVMVLFISLALLWLFRDLPDVGGWGMLFKDVITGGKTVSDSTAAMLIAIILFIAPREMPTVFCCGKTNDSGEVLSPKYKPILTWELVEKKVAWGVIFLLGGGFALAAACTDSGLSTYVGCRLRVFSDMEPWLMNLVLCCIVAGATEITSNTATAIILMPIMFELALSIGQNPLYLMISAAVSCSFAFMLPVATPPNAIVFSTGYVKIPDMMAAGSVMNILAILTLTLAVNTWGNAIFGFDTVPAIFNTTLSQSKCESALTTVLTNTSAMTTDIPQIVTT